MSWPDLQVIYEDFLIINREPLQDDNKTCDGYVAGFLAFKELSPFLDLWTKLCLRQPDFIPQVRLHRFIYFNYLTTPFYSAQRLF